MISLNPKQRFSNRAADYALYRPGYPMALLDLLRAECGLHSESIIADVASGTGLLSQLFLENGNRVFGIEPNQEMREAGERFLREHGNFTSVNGSAEATTLVDNSVDFVTVGQAFHWFDPSAAHREFARILKPSGWVVIVWNDRRTAKAPLTQEFENLLERFGIDYKHVKDTYPQIDRIHRFFDDALVQRDLPNHHILDWEGFQGLLRSSSFMPTEGHSDFAAMMKELERIFSIYQQDGRVRMEYFARTFFGQPQPGRPANAPLTSRTEA
jgi:SAM-dependent methyltransferase